MTEGSRSAYCGASYHILFSKSDQIKGDEMGGAGSKHGRDERSIKKLVWKN
jgi:hypothetical protein